MQQFPYGTVAALDIIDHRLQVGDGLISVIECLQKIGLCKVAGKLVHVIQYTGDPFIIIPEISRYALYVSQDVAYTVFLRTHQPIYLLRRVLNSLQRIGNTLNTALKVVLEIAVNRIIDR